VGKIAAISLAVVACVAIAAVSMAAFRKDTFDLQCDLTDHSGRHGYAFHVQIPRYFGRPDITMVGGNTFDLKVGRFDDTKIYATLDVRLSGWPDNADAMSFDFNRLTGAAEVEYLHKPTAAELKEDPHPPPPDFWLVLDDSAQHGICQKVRPAF
jgi:hypothetical protein